MKTMLWTSERRDSHSEKRRHALKAEAPSSPAPSFTSLLHSCPPHRERPPFSKHDSETGPAAGPHWERDDGTAPGAVWGPGGGGGQCWGSCRDGGSPRGQNSLHALPQQAVALLTPRGQAWLVAAGRQEIWQPAREAVVMTLPTAEGRQGPTGRPHAPVLLCSAGPLVSAPAAARCRSGHTRARPAGAERVSGGQ